ncbi:MAG: hypothetical protein QOD92_206 [Acidimicrobiaceae bacterium]|jgi:hypothetical protein
MVVLVTLLGVAVGLLALLVAGLLRSHAEILRSLHELGVSLDPDAARSLGVAGATIARRDGGSTIADINGPDPGGAPQHLAVAGVGHSSLLAFLSSNCLTCRDFWSAFSDPSLVVPNDARVIVVTRGVEAESPDAVRKLASPLVHTVMSTETWHDYKVPGAPYFILVDGPRGEVVGEGTATTWERVQNLMAQAGADDREQRSVDRDLRAAGIEPGDSSLYPERER